MPTAIMFNHVDKQQWAKMALNCTPKTRVRAHLFQFLQSNIFDTEYIYNTPKEKTVFKYVQVFNKTNLRDLKAATGL